MTNTNGCIAVDKKGNEVLFLAPNSGALENAIGGFSKTVHELLVSPQTSRAYVPIFGDGIHGNNPNPGHEILVMDLDSQQHLTTIDVSPLRAPHTMRLGPDGMVYVTCENSGVVAIIDPALNSVIGTIETGSRNCHRLEVSPDGTRIYTENEEDCSISVIDLAARRLLGQIATPHPLGGLAVSADGKTIVAVDDEAPAVFLIDAERGALSETVFLDCIDKPAQIARYAPDFSLLAVTSMASDSVILLTPDFRTQTVIATGHQPMDMAFHGHELHVACQGDGTIHVIDVKNQRSDRSYSAGVGCEAVAFY